MDCWLKKGRLEDLQPLFTEMDIPTSKRNLFEQTRENCKKKRNEIITKTIFSAMKMLTMYLIMS